MWDSTGYRIPDNTGYRFLPDTSDTGYQIQPDTRFLAGYQIIPDIRYIQIRTWQIYHTRSEDRNKPDQKIIIILLIIILMMVAVYWYILSKEKLMSDLVLSFLILSLVFSFLGLMQGLSIEVDARALRCNNAVHIISAIFCQRKFYYNKKYECNAWLSHGEAITIESCNWIDFMMKQFIQTNA